MPTDKKISELPVAASVNASDTSVLVNNDTDYQYTFTVLLQFLQANLVTGANISFGTTLPQNTSGKNGDVFVNTATGSFAQKVSGTWTVVYTLPAAGAADGTLIYGAGLPATGTGKNLDSYINTLTGIFYKKSADVWSQVFSMATGPQGPQGSAGANGTNGADGNTILFGTINPSNSTTGVNGNFYINTSNYTLFGPKTGGAWNDGVSLLGVGLPNGGSTGQILIKADGADYNAAWEDNSFANITGNPVDNANLSAALSAKQDSLGYTPENTANKNQANGYPGLDGSGKVPAAQLPAYVDDVLEFANYASLPAPGETGKIYITLNDNAEYRWSGSTYIQLVASPGSTDAVPEGSINKYFTVARVLAIVLTGIGFSSATAVSATDTLLQAVGKLQAQITALFKIPTGGTSGQILAKIDGTDGNTHWIDAPTGSGESGDNWTLSGSDIFNNNSGNIGIGISTPGVGLDIQKHTVITEPTNGSTLLKNNWNTHNALALANINNGGLSAISYHDDGLHEKGAIGWGNSGVGDMFGEVIYIETSNYLLGTFPTVESSQDSTLAQPHFRIVTTGNVGGSPGFDFYRRFEVSNDGHVRMYNLVPLGSQVAIFDLNQSTKKLTLGGDLGITLPAYTTGLLQSVVYNTTNNRFEQGAGVGAGGANGQVQINSGGALTGTSNFTVAANGQTYIKAATGQTLLLDVASGGSCGIGFLVNGNQKFDIKVDATSFNIESSGAINIAPGGGSNTTITGNLIIDTISLGNVNSNYKTIFGSGGTSSFQFETHYYGNTKNVYISNAGYCLPYNPVSAADYITNLNTNFIIGDGSYSNTAAYVAFMYASKSFIMNGVGGTFIDDASAIMQLNSTQKGALLPRMTSAQRDAITSPSEGLEIYNLTTHTKNFFNGTVWRQITDIAA